jgi:hypothetical protein
MAGAMGLNYKMNGLVTHVQGSQKDLQRPFYAMRPEDTTKGGIVAILRAFSSGHASAETVKNYADDIISTRLDMVAGSPTIEKDKFNMIFAAALETSKKAYNVIFVDAGSGINETSKFWLNKADAVVVPLGPHISLFEEVFKGDSIQKLLKDKKVLYCLSGVNVKSKHTPKKIRAMYKIDKKQFCHISYSVDFYDAYNSNDLLKFLDVSRKTKAKVFELNEEVEYVKSLSMSCARLIDYFDIPLVEEVLM